LLNPRIPLIFNQGSGSTNVILMFVSTAITVIKLKL